jgi:hypothetical protein
MKCCRVAAIAGVAALPLAPSAPALPAEPLFPAAPADPPLVTCEPSGLSSLLHAKPSPKASTPNTPSVRSFIQTSEGKREI